LYSSVAIITLYNKVYFASIGYYTALRHKYLILISQIFPNIHVVCDNQRWTVTDYIYLIFEDLYFT